MCGIVGLFSKSLAVSEQLGSHLSAMLVELSDRGPDSAGVALYRDPAVLRHHPAMERLRALALAGRPRPVTPYYLLLSATVQPEFSAALVGVKRPERAIADADKRLGYFLQAVR